MKGFPTDSQEPLFCFSNLEDQVPQNHHRRGINQYLDVNELHRYLAEHYSNTGRLSIDHLHAGYRLQLWHSLRAQAVQHNIEK